ncbi:MAG: hypothetical protein KJZ80_20530 [Hyphomicrobiaceae bacterium]|nr:hypothetical protein [Hyphomicrobiaceae bacterium]
MSGTMAVAGALGGALVCAVAGRIGAGAVLRAAANDEQRQVLRRILSWAGFYAAAVMSAVLLASFQVLPPWAYTAALLAWFGPLLPALAWAHHRLDAAAGGAGFEPSLSVA